MLLLYVVEFLLEQKLT